MNEIYYGNTRFNVGFAPCPFCEKMNKVYFSDNMKNTQLKICSNFDKTFSYMIDKIKEEEADEQSFESHDRH